MKKKFLGITTMILSVILLSGISISVSNFNNADRTLAANTTDDSKESWSAIGTINGTNWNKDFPLTYDSADDRYELQISLNSNEEFKIRLNNAWTTSIGYGGHTGAGISTYLSNSGGNFKVKTTGAYILWVKDDNVRNYGDKSYGFGIDKIETVKYTLNFYNIDGEIVDTTEVIKDSIFDSKFIEVEGYRFEGWYTDPELTNKLEKGTAITSDYDLYPKYVEAKDFDIFIDVGTILTGDINAYLWRDSSDGEPNAAWPGVKQTVKCSITNLIKVSIDASKSFTKIIINNNDNQTVDTVLDVEGYNNIYTLTSTKDSEGKFKVDISGGEYYVTKAIKTLAGGWNNIVSTNNCTDNYSTIKNVILELNEDDLNSFKTSEGSEITNARTTYEHWCKVNNDPNYYFGDVVSGARVAFGVNDNSMYLIIIIALVSVSFIGFVIIKKKRQTN